MMRQEFPELSIQTNFGRYVLKDAVWVEEENRPGVGTVTGHVVSGGDTSRILQYTSFEDKAGTEQSFYNVVLNRMHSGYPPHFDLTFF
jgi:hypothetical protein